LSIQEGLRNRNLINRIKFRLGKDSLTSEEIFCFAIGHELGHLVQALADYTSIENHDLSNLDNIQIEALRIEIEKYNKSIRENQEILEAQEYFRSIFGTDINRDPKEANIDPLNYTEEEYLRYVNSTAEANADFISLWLMGMQNPGMKSSPQNKGYRINDWEKWVEENKITKESLA